QPRPHARAPPLLERQRHRIVRNGAQRGQLDQAKHSVLRKTATTEPRRARRAQRTTNGSRPLISSVPTCSVLAQAGCLVLIRCARCARRGSAVVAVVQNKK